MTEPTTEAGRIKTALAAMRSALMSGEGWTPQLAEAWDAAWSESEARATAPAGLDAAWAEAEAALQAAPPNRIGARWHLGRLMRTAPAFEEQWWAEAQRATGGNYDAFNSGWHATPAAALRALRAALAAESEPVERRRAM